MVVFFSFRFSHVVFFLYISARSWFESKLCAWDLAADTVYCWCTHISRERCENVHFTCSTLLFYMNNLRARGKKNWHPRNGGQWKCRNCRKETYTNNENDAFLPLWTNYNLSRWSYSCTNHCHYNYILCFNNCCASCLLAEFIYSIPCWNLTEFWCFSDTWIYGATSEDVFKEFSNENMTKVVDFSCCCFFYSALHVDHYGIFSAVCVCMCVVRCVCLFYLLLHWMWWAQ